MYIYACSCDFYLFKNVSFFVLIAYYFFKNNVKKKENLFRIANFSTPNEKSSVVKYLFKSSGLRGFVFICKFLWEVAVSLDLGNNRERKEESQNNLKVNH